MSGERVRSQSEQSVGGGSVGHFAPAGSGGNTKDDATVNAVLEDLQMLLRYPCSHISGMGRRPVTRARRMGWCPARPESHVVRSPSGECLEAAGAT
jgi:hypothetical protein